jgi:branched-chain amino acid transport system permease protein
MVTVNTLIEIAVDGIALGLFYSLLGVGITLVFGLGEVLNLAIGAFAVIAMLAAQALAPSVGIAPAAVLSVGGIAVFGLAVDRTVLSFVYRSEGEERVLLGIFVTLGLALMLEGALTQLFPSSYSLPVGLGAVQVGPVSLVLSSLVTIAVAGVVLALLFAFLRLTYLGKATRTVFQDETGALLVGVRPRRIRTLIFVLSTVVAGIAGLLTGLSGTLSVADAFEFTIFALIVSIIGGVRSVEGAVLAGVLLGVVVQFANFFIGSFIASMAVFATAIVVLLAKPGALT